MRLNAIGDVLMGAGGVPGSLNGTFFPFVSYGRGAWQNDRTVIVALRDAGAALARWHPSSPQRPVILQPPRGANDVTGGGDRWMALGNIPGTRDSLLYGSFGERPYAGFGDIAEDGTIAFKTVYQSDRGLTIMAPDGTETHLPDVAPLDLQALPGGTAIWRHGAFGRQPVQPFYANATDVMLATVGTTEWLLYRSDGLGLVLQPDGADEGYVLETQGRSFGFDMTGGPFLTIVWSVTLGEFPQDLVKLYATRDALQFVIDPEVRLLPRWQKFTASIEPMPVIGRPLWIGWFEFGTPTFPPPGNCVLSVDAEMLVRSDEGSVIAQYVSSQPEGDLEALERAIAAAVKRPGVPRLAYWTRGPQGIRVPRGAELVGIEAYRGVDETLTAFERRLRFAVAQSPRAWLLAQGYTSNASLTTDLAALVPVYARIARDCPNVEGILVFSAGTRQTGWNDHPEIHDAWRQLAAGIPAAPPIVVAPSPRPSPQEPTPMPQTPSLDAWINAELPQLTSAYRANPSNAPAMQDDPHAPHAEWGAFQTYRRYVEGWTFPQMLHHEQTQGTTPEPP